MASQPMASSRQRKQTIYESIAPNPGRTGHKSARRTMRQAHDPGGAGRPAPSPPAHSPPATLQPLTRSTNKQRWSRAWGAQRWVVQPEAALV